LEETARDWSNANKNDGILVVEELWAPSMDGDINFGL
jgi:hypothetical protein